MRNHSNMESSTEVASFDSHISCVFALRRKAEVWTCHGRKRKGEKQILRLRRRMTSWGTGDGTEEKWLRTSVRALAYFFLGLIARDKSRIYLRCKGKSEKQIPAG